jgi:hypothetical protein
MSAKQLRAIAVGVALLLVLWGATELWPRRTIATTDHPALPVISVNDVDTVVITHGPDTVLLVKQSPAAWTVNRHPAAQSGIDEFFQAFRDSVRPEVVAENPSSFARMGVDSGLSRLVRLAGGGKTLAQAFVGEPGPGGEASYVRIPGDVRVYLLPGPLPALAGRSVDDWRNREIGGVVPESIAAVEIQRGSKRTALRKQGSNWVMAGGAPADSTAVAHLLLHLRSVSAAGFASDRQMDSLKFARPERRISVIGTDARTLLAFAFDSTAGGFWVREAAGGAIYRLDFWKVDALTPSEDALKPHP